jgi:hypothetical protein
VRRFQRRVKGLIPRYRARIHSVDTSRGAGWPIASMNLLASGK